VTTDTRRNEILTGVLILGLTLGLFAAGEALMRVLHWREYGPDGSLRDVSNWDVDEHTGLRLHRPNRRLGNIRVNNLGFRGPDLPLRKPEGTFRLAFLGSSATLDVYSPDGGSWPHLLSERIREAVEGCRVDYVNAGMPGFGVDEVLRHHASQVVPTNPDIILVMTGGVSSDLDELAQAQGFEVHHGRLIRRLGSYSLLLEKLERGFRMISAARAAGSRANKLRFEVQPLARAHADDLRKLVGALSGDGGLTAVISRGGKLHVDMSADEMARESLGVLYRRPFIYLPDLVALREAYNAVLPGAVAEAGGIVLQGIEASAQNSRYYRDRTHFNAAGSRLMADRLAPQLLARQEVVDRLEQRGCSLRRAPDAAGHGTSPATRKEVDDA
jgi:lysophospholipase L1-like esterase